MRNQRSYKIFGDCENFLYQKGLTDQWIGAHFANQADTKILKVIFGAFLVIIGSYMIVGTK
jgi:hypothetical protein